MKEILKTAAPDTRARKYLAALYDEGGYSEIGALKTCAQGNAAGVVTAFGYINSRVVYTFVQERESNSVMNRAQAEKIVKLYQFAAKTGSPVVGIFDSDGAFVNGTVASLKDFGLILEQSAKISGVVPQINIVAGVCAGSAALLAHSADFVIAVKSSEFYYTPVFSDETKGSNAEAAYRNGTLSNIADDIGGALNTARKILQRLPQNNLDKQMPFPVETDPQFDKDDVLKSITDPVSSVELYNGFGPPATLSLARINGESVGVISVKGTLCFHASRKIARFVRTLDAFSVPIVTLIDTEGFRRDLKAEASGGMKLLSALANSYAEATTAKIAIVTGKAIGAAFTALTNTADFVYAWDSAVIAPLAPETYVEWAKRDDINERLKTSDLAAVRAELIKEYEQNEASAYSAENCGAIDAVIKPEHTRAEVINALTALEGKREHKLPKKHSNLPI